MATLEPKTSVVLRYIRNSVSEEERMQVDNWLKEDPENEKALLQIARIYYSCRTQERLLSRDPLHAYWEVRQKINGRKRKMWFQRACVAAACFVGVLIVSSAISFWTQKEVLQPSSQMVTVQANAGMRTHFNLPDGTVVYLNSGSTLSYPLPYDEKERRVNLSGEAYFKVAHNPDQPFVVSVRDDRMRVKVLGTEFNLQAYNGDDNIGTTLVSGSVMLEVRDDHKTIQEAKLIPSEKAILDLSSGNISVQKVNTEYETAWIEGRLMFKDLPLPQVLKKLSYFYNVKFEVQDSVINSYCFTGTFENKQLSQVLDYLKISSQIDYVIRHATTDDSLGTQYTTVILKKRK